MNLEPKRRIMIVEVIKPFPSKANPAKSHKPGQRMVMSDIAWATSLITTGHAKEVADLFNEETVTKEKKVKRKTNTKK